MCFLKDSKQRVKESDQMPKTTVREHMRKLKDKTTRVTRHQRKIPGSTGSITGKDMTAMDQGSSDPMPLPQKRDNRTFKLFYDEEWNEWQVQVFDNGILNENATYHAADKEDAELTMKAMEYEDEHKVRW